MYLILNEHLPKVLENVKNLAKPSQNQKRFTKIALGTKRPSQGMKQPTIGYKMIRLWVRKRPNRWVRKTSLCKKRIVYETSREGDDYNSNGTLYAKTIQKILCCKGKKMKVSKHI